jgi:hypothetical protein
MSEQPSRQGIYFYLSYAHSAPTSDYGRTDPDPSVGKFFDDLEVAVSDRARPSPGMRIGFYDRQIDAETDIKVLVSRALGAAEVFVALYSPGYFAKSWPQREQEVFRRRLQMASATAPDRHIIPVLWTPIPSWEEKPDVLRMRQHQPDDPVYAENGLRALCMLSAYRSSYLGVLTWLAERIVTVAEEFPLGPSRAPGLDDVPAPEQAEPTFVVAMLAPAYDAAQTVDSAPRSWWRTYPGRRIPTVVERAGTVAERLGLSTRVGDLADVEKYFDRSPTIVIVDPQVVAVHGSEFLTSTFAGLPGWVVPLLLDEGRPGPVTALAESAAQALSGASGSSVVRVHDVRELDEVLPAVVARARRSFLRSGKVFPPPDTTRRPPRLRDADVVDDERDGTGE